MKDKNINSYPFYDVGVNTDIGVSDDLVILKPHISNEIIINLDGDIEETVAYRQAFKAIYNSTSTDLIHLVINTDGGYLSTAIAFFNMLMNCSAQTIAEINKAYSAGSLIALSCDQVVVNRFSSMMVHTVSYGAWGKSSEIAVNVKCTNAITKDIISTLYEGFLTDKEIESTINGKDYWFNEKEIIKRLKKWQPVRYRKKN